MLYVTNIRKESYPQLLQKARLEHFSMTADDAYVLLGATCPPRHLKGLITITESPKHQ